MLPSDLHVSMAFLGAVLPFLGAAVKGIGKLFANKSVQQALPGIGSVLGGAAKGRGENQQVLAQQQYLQDALRQRMWENQAQNVNARNQALLAQGRLGAENVQARNRALLDQGQLGLQGQKFGLEAPNVRAGQAVRGDIMANMQDVGVNRSRVGGENRLEFTGGMRPSLMGPASRGAGALLAQLGQSQLGKDQFTTPQLVPDQPLPTLVPDIGPPPDLSKWADPRGGKLGDILGGTSLAAQLLSQLPWDKWRQSQTDVE